MAYKKNDPCLEKAFEDEMLFVLMARDETAPAMVIEWIKINLRKQPEEKLREAFECAMKMIKTRIVREHPSGKIKSIHKG